VSTSAALNHFGVVKYDEELLATEFVHSVGQLLGVVVAKTRRSALFPSFPFPLLLLPALICSGIVTLVQNCPGCCKAGCGDV
jgi:hypothetical protein